MEKNRSVEGHDDDVVTPKEQGRSVDELQNPEIDLLKQKRAALSEELGETQELTPEHAELLASMEKQYPEWQKVFAHYEVSTKDMPTWEEVRSHFLPPEVLEAARNLEQPVLNMTPPLTRQEMIKQINEHRVSGQTKDIYTYELEDDELWSDGEPEKELKWEVSVVEGVQDVLVDLDIYPCPANNAEIADVWVKKLKEKGLKPLSSARRYLSLMMKALQEGKPIDQNAYTVLNVETRKPNALLSIGFWDIDQVRLAYGYPAYRFVTLRVRGSAGVDTN